MESRITRIRLPFPKQFESETSFRSNFRRCWHLGGQNCTEAMPRVRRLQSKSSIVSCISWAYHGHIIGVSWAYLRHIMGISQAYLGHISGIPQAYLGHIIRHILGISSGISWAYHQAFHTAYHTAYYQPYHQARLEICRDCHDRRSCKKFQLCKFVQKTTCFLAKFA